MFESSDLRRAFAAAAMQAAFVRAMKLALSTRRDEEGFSHRMLAERTGRSRPNVTRALAGGDWKLSTIHDFAEALDVRLEVAFVDRRNPLRRFTPGGVEYAQAELSESGSNQPA